MKTFRFRLKSKNLSSLDDMAHAVNFVWNYCNQASIEFLDKKAIWLSKYDLQKLTAGCSKELRIHSKTIQAVCRKYADNRYTVKKRKLAWRSRKSLGWVPFTEVCVFIVGDSVRYRDKTFRFWNSRPISGKIKCGSFSQDSRGRWYINFNCEVEKSTTIKSGGEVGIDLGLKTIATLSNGGKLTRENITKKYAERLAKAQRARKPRQIKSLHAKIRNIRKDWNHKQTTKLINQYDRIVVGNVSSPKLLKTRMAKSVTDASWADFKSMLAYKAIALGVVFQEVNEMFSTVTCSGCLEKTGPSGLGALGVREWICKSCGTAHDRDVNAAQNILRFGRESLIKRNPLNLL